MFAYLSCISFNKRYIALHPMTGYTQSRVKHGKAINVKLARPQCNLVQDPFLSFLEFFNIFSLETLLRSVWSINCLTSLTPEANFLLRILLLPLFFAVGPALSHTGFVFAAWTARRLWFCLLQVLQQVSAHTGKCLDPFVRFSSS